MAAGSAYSFHPTRPTRLAGLDPGGGQHLGRGPGATARLARQAEVGEQVAAQRHRRSAGQAEALVAHQHGRVALRAEHQQRLLEARVEPGQVGQVGAVLPVGVDHQPVPALRRRPLPKALDAVPVHPGRHLRHLLRHAEVRQVEGRRPGGLHPVSPGRALPGSPVAHLGGAARITAKPSASTSLPGPPLAAGPLHPDLGSAGVPQAEVDPTHLAAGVAAADGQFPQHGALPRPHLDPGADGIAVGPGWASWISTQ